MKVLETDRLVVRWLTTEDAAFVLELLNEPGWLRFIGNRNITTLEDARGYITRVMTGSYERNGFGLYAVDVKESGEPVGICGLIKREGLEDVDVGFAFLERHWGRGYAYESAAAVMEHARNDLGLDRIVAITLAENAASIRVLERLGLRREGTVVLPGDDAELELYG